MICENQVYPSNERQSCDVFALKYLKWIHGFQASLIGPEAVAILTAVVTFEDDLYYSRAPDFTNDQLMRRAGFVNENTFRSSRQKAIDKGFLYYKPGAKGRGGVYWVKGFTSNFEEKATRKPQQTHKKATTPNLDLITQTLESVENADASPSLDMPNEVLTTWNSLMGQRAKLTDSRRSKIKARLRDRDFAAQWRSAIERASKSPFCCGDNDRGWRADIDWFLKPDSYVYLIEGKYENSPLSASVSTVDRPELKFTPRPERPKNNVCN